MCKDKIILFVFFVIASALAGCAVTSSGNVVGESAAVKYSTDEKKYRIAEIGMMFAAAGEKRRISSLHSDVEISGGSLNLRASLISLNYSLLGQKGGLFISVPMTIPLDMGIRPSFVQWVGPVYLGAGVSFVGGFYPNEQNDDYETEADDSFGRFDGFILYNFGGGTMIDIGEKFALGVYVNYERMALNSGGSNVKGYGFYLDIVDETHGKENLPEYAKRANVMTLGLNAFIKMKNPLGFYAEYSPGKLMYNDDWWKFRVGTVLLY
ncbi:MAG: hypothetical protein HUK21_06565 [Fibrobacteraceae bacterium]|nr:hypothetical protein [Fibrobacteraceae bacterium]